MRYRITCGIESDLDATAQITINLDRVGYGSLLLGRTLTGDTIDSDGFTRRGCGHRERQVGTNETITIDSIVPGEQLVTLTGLSKTYDVVGDNPRTVDIVPQATQTEEFRVHCVDGQFRGNPHVTVLPPRGPTHDRREFAGEFAPDLGLAIEICKSTGSEWVGNPIATFNAFADRIAESIVIRDSTYAACWLTSQEHKLEAQGVYRIAFRVDALELAHADIFLFEGSCLYDGPDGGLQSIANVRSGQNKAPSGVSLIR